MNRPLFALVALTAGIAGCATAPPNGAAPVGPSAADNHRIKVSQVGERLELPVAANDLTLSAAAQQDLSRFARSYNDGGHGALMLSIPSGGANAAAASRIAQQARLILAENGVPYAAIAGSTYDAAGADASPIQLSYMRFEATAPECTPMWRQDLAHPVNNATYESFGCAAVANLAAMVADPRDLVSPRDEAPRDAGRRATVMKHYREGEQTHAVRSQDERITVSDAVN
ncbi:MAG: CpaD family pilus assembly protein [Hyphomonadaceae bacterium]|nr:CpaD family pilus assembly protein [Hyphomonadaceae bacterium]